MPVNSVDNLPTSGKPVDILIIGGGIMGASLATLCNALEPDWSILMLERDQEVAKQCSNARDNAGTGHAAYCEVNYTPETAEGINISKAIGINQSFTKSLEFWAWLAERNKLGQPSQFIRCTPHMTFVWGEQNVNFMQHRHEMLSAHPNFSHLKLSSDPAQIREWAPLLMEQRDSAQQVSASWTDRGTDVDYGEITRQMIGGLQQHGNFNLKLQHSVRDLRRNPDGTWCAVVDNLANPGQRVHVNARFVFIGAGGYALELLQRSGIPEARNFAGFPVGGQFLVTSNPELVARHHVKVYGKASVGAPPMSVPHLDVRVIDGRKYLFFGPFATFSTRLHKSGSVFDLARTINMWNIPSMLRVGMDNMHLIRYLISQLLLTERQRLDMLREFYPAAKDEDWTLHRAGQRVQVIQRKAGQRASLQLGTQLVTATDGSISALLGASPGASTAIATMLRLLERCFSEKYTSAEWQQRLQEIFPSLETDKELQPNAAHVSYDREYIRAKLELDI